MPRHHGALRLCLGLRELWATERPLHPVIWDCLGRRCGCLATRRPHVGRRDCALVHLTHLALQWTAPRWRVACIALQLGNVGLYFCAVATLRRHFCSAGCQRLLGGAHRDEVKDLGTSSLVGDLGLSPAEFGAERSSGSMLSRSNFGNRLERGVSSKDRYRDGVNGVSGPGGLSLPSAFALSKFSGSGLELSVRTEFFILLLAGCPKDGKVDSEGPRLVRHPKERARQPAQ